MEAFYIYILKVNIALVIFWLFCHLVIWRDTFIELRRVCLFTVLVLSFTYPLVDFSGWILQERTFFLDTLSLPGRKFRNDACPSFGERSELGNYFVKYLFHGSYLFRNPFGCPTGSNLSLCPKGKGLYLFRSAYYFFKKRDRPLFFFSLDFSES